MHRLVASGEVTLKFTVFANDVDGEIMYDYFLDNGTESLELFDSVEEAIDEIERRYGRVKE